MEQSAAVVAVEVVDNQLEELILLALLLEKLKVLTLVTHGRLAVEQVVVARAINQVILEAIQQLAAAQVIEPVLAELLEPLVLVVLPEVQVEQQVITLNKTATLLHGQLRVLEMGVPKHE
jgi:hypothetical protein